MNITFSLNDASYRPHHKPYSNIVYLHKEINHPENILQQIPLSIENRLYTASSNKEEFIQAIRTYIEALKKPCYNYDIKHKPKINNEKSDNNNINIANKLNKRTCKSNIIWFNPPFRNTVTPNNGKCFLKL